MRLLLLTILLSFLLVGAPAPRYVAPYGAGVACTADAPCVLDTALASGGDVWLLPGTYHGNVTIAQPGTALQSAPGTRAKIDGGITIGGAGSAVRGLEIYDSSWTTRATATPAQQARCICVQAPNVTISDVWAHDLARGIEAFNGSGGQTAGLRLEHNLIYNIGYGTTGHAIYLQNDSAGEKTIAGNTLVNQYGFGVHAYGSGGPSAQLERMTFDGNVVANSRFLVGGGRPVDAITITHNLLWQSGFQLGYSTNITNVSALVTDNYAAGGVATIRATRFAALTVAHNTFVREAAGGGIRTIAIAQAPFGGWAWGDNAYYQPGGATFDIAGQGFYNFTNWKAATGLDTTSTASAAMPADQIDVQSQGVHHGRVTVFNWTNAATVTVDLASLNLTSGASYRLVNAQNPAESLAFTAGSPVHVPMTGWTVATPIGASAPLRTWDQRFGVFLLAPA